MRGSVAPIIGSQPLQTTRLDRTLKYALVQSRDELMPQSNSGLIHIEYQTGSDGPLNFFKIWASTRGCPSIVVELTQDGLCFIWGKLHRMEIVDAVLK